MIAVNVAVGAVCLVVGFLIGRRRAASHASRAIAAASNDGLKLAEFAWNHAALAAKRDGFSTFPAKQWSAMTSVQRDAVYRIAEATVAVVKREAEHRSGLSGSA